MTIHIPKVTYPPQVLFGSNQDKPPVSTALVLVRKEPPTDPPQDVLDLGIKSRVNVDVNVAHQNGTVTGTYDPAVPPTPPDDTDGDGTEGQGQPTSNTQRQTRQLNVMVHGPVAYDLGFTSEGLPIPRTAQGHVQVDVGDTKPLEVLVRRTESDTQLTGTDIDKPRSATTTRTEVSAVVDKAQVHVDGQKDGHNGSLQVSYGADSLKVGTVHHRQTNELLQPAEVPPPQDGESHEDDSDGAESDTPSPDGQPVVTVPTRRQSGDTRSVTVELGQTARKKEDDPLAGPLQVQVQYDASSHQPGSATLNGSGSLSVPFKVGTRRNEVHFSTDEATGQQLEYGSTSSSSTTVGHVKLDGHTQVRGQVPASLLGQSPAQIRQVAQATPQPVRRVLNALAWLVGRANQLTTTGQPQVVTEGPPPVVTADPPPADNEATE